MLYWALTFFIVSILAGVLGFTGISAAIAGAAQILFFVFIGLFVLSILLHVARSADQTISKNL